MLHALGWLTFIWGAFGWLAITTKKANAFPHPLAKSIIIVAIPLYWIVTAICWSH